MRSLEFFYTFLERSQDTRDAWSGHLESFVQSKETPHVFHLGDVFWLHVNEGVIPMRGHLQGTSFLPDPACNVCRVWEDYNLMRFYPEVGLVEFVEDLCIVVSSLHLSVTTNHDVILDFGDYSLLHLFLENLGHKFI